jgi:hypothetical protein
MTWIFTDNKPLGEKNADDSYTLFEGFENLRLFAVRVNTTHGEYYLYTAGYIDGGGSIVAHDSGDNVGWEWDAVEAYVDIIPPNNVIGSTPAQTSTPAGRGKDGE